MRKRGVNKLFVLNDFWRDERGGGKNTPIGMRESAAKTPVTPRKKRRYLKGLGVIVDGGGEHSLKKGGVRGGAS